MKTLHPHQLTDPTLILKFVLAGAARFTLVSKKTGARFTYRVRKPDELKPHFVSVLAGPENETDYRFIGSIFSNETYKPGRLSKVSLDAPSSVAFIFFWTLISCGRLHDQLEFWHEGRCCACGRTLTVPTSIEAGIGPECASRA